METGVHEHWECKKIEVKKFIDDVSGAEKLHCNDTYASKILDSGEEVRYVKAQQAQDLFDRVRDRAAVKGMKLNPKKTTLLCISAARTYTPKTYISIGEKNDIIISGKSMKLLGFHFDGKPTAEAHVKAILKKVRYRTCLLYTSPSPRDS